MAAGVRMRCKAPTSAQVTVTNRDPEDAEPEGSDEGVAAEAGASAAAGVSANSEELTSDEVTASAPQTAAVSIERRGRRAIGFGNRLARLGDFLRRGAGLCLLSSITIWWLPMIYRGARLDTLRFRRLSMARRRTGKGPTGRFCRRLLAGSAVSPIRGAEPKPCWPVTRLHRQVDDEFEARQCVAPVADRDYQLSRRRAGQIVHHRLCPGVVQVGAGFNEQE